MFVFRNIVASVIREALKVDIRTVQPAKNRIPLCHYVHLFINSLISGATSC